MKQSQKQILKNSLKWIHKHWIGLLTLVLVPIVYALSLAAESHQTVYEKFGTATTLRMLLSRLTGVFSFSLGEWVLIGHVLLVPILIAFFVVKLWRGGALRMLYRITVYAAALYIAFMMLWGFNYSRMSIGNLIGLEVRPYTVEELYDVTMSLAESANTLRENILEDSDGIMTISGGYRTVFEDAPAGYDAISVEIPALAGVYGNAKPIALSKQMLYTGITGVFFPYTAEANVNVAVPDLLLPATTLHEMAHQRGFAPEDEANFIAYLTARAHPDPTFQYSGTVLALIHVYNALAAQNSALAAEVSATFSDGLKRDLAAQSAFWADYQGKTRETAERVNDTYLKSNRQTDGTRSYGRMVDWVIADYLNRESDL